jgi:hypothetical protein
MEYQALDDDFVSVLAQDVSVPGDADASRRYATL